MNLKYINTIVFSLVGLYILLAPYPAAAAEKALLDSKTNRTFVPVRFVSENLGAKVNWDSEKYTVSIEDDQNTILLSIGEQEVLVNKGTKTIDTAPFIKNSITYVPLRFVSTVLGADIDWEPKTASVQIQIPNTSIITLTTELLSPSMSTDATKQHSGSAFNHVEKNFIIEGNKISSNIITVDLTSPAIDLSVALAKNKVGAVDSLENIAKQHDAVVAINGSFFDAYTDLKEPYGVIIIDGKIVHVGKERTVISFDEKNNVTFNIANPEIVGSTNGSAKWPNNWYSYWINRTPQFNSSASVVIYTPERGDEVGFDYGTNIVVEKGKVVHITNGNVKIPKDGFVINLIGTEVHNLHDRFKIGTTVSYQVVDESLSIESTDGAIGAGPRLITDGKVSINFENEGFQDMKIIKDKAARSAIGVTKDNKLLFLTTSGATIHELAEMMLKAGAYQAINLDGGASSGLYYNGMYLTKPGREISNAILVKHK
ncbi:phosphodiester glycosidase family protein [Bacillus sp. Marseille-P3661]|uniref:phosphodiester glycosidase family protein n=1 Tax=Bacillus sp. Marseille-P3661 TaxID=1936234 RepID=UPI000C852AA0|nr:phosphodiester glycosidase family protein [Bacillus sp. Marseille-P3661]